MATSTKTSDTNRDAVVIASADVLAPSKSMRLRVIVTAMVALGVIALGVTGLNILGNHKPQVSLTETQLTDTINKDILGKHYEDAIKLINSQPDATQPLVQNLLASVYANEGHITQALAVYAGLAKRHQLTQETAEAAAGVAASAHLTSQAVSYYQQAITLSHTNHGNPVAQAEAQSDTQAIQQLKGQR